MLDKRPEQDVFTHLIQWPPPVQRSVDELLHLIDADGFDLERATVATGSPDEAVYAVVAVQA